MYQEKLIQGSRLRRPPEANDIAGVYAVISCGEKIDGYFLEDSEGVCVLVLGNQTQQWSSTTR